MWREEEVTLLCIKAVDSLGKKSNVKIQMSVKLKLHMFKGALATLRLERAGY